MRMRWTWFRTKKSGLTRDRVAAKSDNVCTHVMNVQRAYPYHGKNTRRRVPVVVARVYTRPSGAGRAGRVVKSCRLSYGHSPSRVLDRIARSAAPRAGPYAFPYACHNTTIILHISIDSTVPFAVSFHAPEELSRYAYEHPPVDGRTKVPGVHGLALCWNRLPCCSRFM